MYAFHIFILFTTAAAGIKAERINNFRDVQKCSANQVRVNESTICPDLEGNMEVTVYERQRPMPNKIYDVVSTYSAVAYMSSKNYESLCHNHTSMIIQLATEKYIPALKMLDSGAKIPSGLLNGNMNQFGDFDQCLSVRVGNVRGKYCLALLDFVLPEKALDDLVRAHRHTVATFDDPSNRIARQSLISWGVCVPQSCSSHDVEESLKESFDFLSPNISIKEELCYVKDDQPLPTGTIFTAILFGFVIVLAVTGSLNTSGHKDGLLGRILHAFSLNNNLKKLLETKCIQDDIDCIHGLRFLNALALLIFHKSAAQMFSPYVNRTSMVESYSLPWSVIGRTAIIYTDSFIMISGLLTSFSLIKEIDARKTLNFFSKVTSRLLRFLPNHLATILFCTYILPHLSSGPQWNIVIGHYADMCKSGMWRNILHIHNYFGFEDMCLTHTHQLGIDMQLFVAGLPLLYLLWRSERKGLTVLFIIATVSTLLRGYVTYAHGLSTVIYFGAKVSQLFDTANLSYTLPTHRATVYIMGLLIGYFLRRYESCITLRKSQLFAGWSVGLFLAFLAMCGPYHMSRKDYQYEPLSAALYNSLSPIMWGAALCWLIVCCRSGFAGWFGDFLAWRGFKVFSRIAYSFYLVQFPVYFFNVGRNRTASFYGHFNLFDLSEVLCITVASLLLTLFVDMPFNGLRNVFRKKGKSEEKPAASLDPVGDVSSITNSLITDQQHLRLRLRSLTTAI